MGCCQALILPRGGVIGPPGVPGEIGIRGDTGLSGASGLNGQISVQQTLKFVKEFRPNNQLVPPFTHNIVITIAELNAAGLPKIPISWNFGGFPSIATYKINIFFYDISIGFYQDIKNALSSGMTLTSLIVNPFGDILVNITNSNSDIRDIRIEVNG